MYKVHIGMKVRFLRLSGTSFVCENGCRGPFAPFGRPVQGTSGHPNLLFPQKSRFYTLLNFFSLLNMMVFLSRSLIINDEDENEVEGVVVEKAED